MNFNNFTIKGQEAVQRAVDLARSGGQQALEPVHLLAALLSGDETVMKFILQKLDIPATMLDRALNAELQRLPRVEGGTLLEQRVGQGD